ncbi:MAG: hypothetical protein COA96_07855 [SAR86 cluster bacterium]|uniref:Uncharacterized protein n=1 Tax=SAR86 cluster bacterium TaxID=2030880 RepID=A0A2A5B0X4_9GAMM|nr:MAG: hypothetical protein COA96_07855 [SAR86 cluster bacterium]
MTHINEQSNVQSPVAWLGAIAVLFGLLLLASQGNELLKQVVIAPGSIAELGVEAQCRADELEEEELSLQECQLMVSNIQIILASSPDWFRSFQITLSCVGGIAAIFSILSGFSIVGGQKKKSRMWIFSFALLLLIDIAGFIAAVNIGPMLRAQYLWPLMLWFFIHLCLLLAVCNIASAYKSTEN